MLSLVKFEPKILNDEQSKTIEKLAELFSLWWVAELHSGMMFIGWALPTAKIDLKCKATFVFPGQIPFLSGSSEGTVSTSAIARACLYVSELTLAVE